MTNVLDRLPSGARVAIIRLRSLGDCVLTTPAIALLKQSRPDLSIAVVAEDRFAPVFAGNPDIAQILAPNASAIARFRPQLALNLHGGATSIRLILAAAARLRAGFAHFRFQPVYNVHIPSAQEILGVDRKVHTAEHIASAMFHLGVPAADIPRARLFAEPVRRPRPYVVLHPLASDATKMWSIENFLALAEHLNDDLGLEPVFIAAANENLAPFAPYTCFEGAPLEDVKSLIASAALFIGNDSGPAHIAAAFTRPVIVFFGSSDIENWRPWRTEHALLSNTAGIHAIPIDEAVRAVDALASLPAPQPYA